MSNLQPLNPQFGSPDPQFFQVQEGDNPDENRLSVQIKGVTLTTLVVQE
jgi:hypothetical protein